jgi:RecB family exonuclease
MIKYSVSFPHRFLSNAASRRTFLYPASSSSINSTTSASTSTSTASKTIHPHHCNRLRLFSTKKASQNTIMSYADILLQDNGSLHLSDIYHSDPTPTSTTITTTTTTTTTTRRTQQDTPPILPYPTSLSPSSAAEFKACPQSYLFQYLFGIRPPTTLALAKGRICHTALEQLFDLEPSQRTLEKLQNQFRLIWSKERVKEEYSHLFDIPYKDDDDDDVVHIQRDVEAERTWGLESLQLLENYYHLEDPRLVPRPNPLEREIWVQAKLTLDPSQGVTGVDHGKKDGILPTKDDNNNNNNKNDNNNNKNDNTNHNSPNTNTNDETFLVRGIVDRLDYVTIPSSPQDTFLKTKEERMQSCVRIVDYKTGKAPEFKYSPLMNELIANQNMWQLKIYALLLKEMIANNNRYSTNATGRGGNLRYILPHQLRLLRLMYLTSGDGEGRYLDMDLGETEEEQNSVLQEVHKDLSEIWKDIRDLVQTQDPKLFRHCDRKFCICHTLRPKFVPGSLYHEP